MNEYILFFGTCSCARTSVLRVRTDLQRRHFTAMCESFARGIDNQNRLGDDIVQYRTEEPLTVRFVLIFSLQVRGNMKFTSADFGADLGDKKNIEVERIPADRRRRKKQNSTVNLNPT